MTPVKVLFVCTGNICRSPTADGVFRKLVNSAGLANRFEIDSAGVIAYHVGEQPDPRSCEEAKKHGVDLTCLRARQLTLDDFDTFDFIFAMDYSHFDDMKAMADIDQHGKIHMFLELIKDSERISEVPDPYYGGRHGFKNVYELIERGCQAWLKEIMSRVS